MSSRMIIICFLALVLLESSSFGSASADMVHAEEEPNNTFEDAERIWEGTTNGTVSPSWAGNDTDYFVVSIPGHQTVRLSIDRAKGNGMAVFVSCYDIQGNLNSDIFIIGDLWKNFRSDEWVNNADDPKDLIIRVSGEGAYTLQIEFIFVLSNFVRSYVDPFTLMGILMGMVAGIFIGLLISRRGARNKEEMMERWAWTRDRGKQRFIVLVTLCYGLIAGTLNTIFHESIDSSRTSHMFWLSTALYYILWTIAGLFLSLYIWWASEKRYKKWIAEKKNEKRIRPRYERSRPGSIRP